MAGALAAPVGQASARDTWEPGGRFGAFGTTRGRPGRHVGGVGPVRVGECGGLGVRPGARGTCWLSRDRTESLLGVAGSLHGLLPRPDFWKGGGVAGPGAGGGGPD